MKIETRGREQMIIAGISFFMLYCIQVCFCSDSSDYIQQIESQFKTVDTDWAHQSAGEYIVENNVWNKRNTENYRQKIGIKKSKHGAIRAGWGWEWPASSSIVAFPDIIFGKNPWADESTTSRLPVQIKNIDSLYVELKMTHLGHGHRNTAFQIWLTDNPACRPEHIRHEIMIWLRNDGLPLAPVRKTLDIDGKQYKLSVMENFGDPQLKPPLKWTYCSFLEPEIFMQGSVNIKRFLNKLIDEGLVSPEEYVAVINFGNEIRDGAGLTVVDNYRISVKSAH